MVQNKSGNGIFVFLAKMFECGHHSSSIVDEFNKAAWIVFIFDPFDRRIIATAFSVGAMATHAILHIYNGDQPHQDFPAALRGPHQTSAVSTPFHLHSHTVFLFQDQQRGRPIHHHRQSREK